jgi:hypothetical protein
LGALGAAYAEVGDFKQAIHWQKKTLEFPEYVKIKGDKTRHRIELYKEGKPCREG